MAAPASARRPLRGPARVRPRARRKSDKSLRLPRCERGCTLNMLFFFSHFPRSVTAVPSGRAGNCCFRISTFVRLSKYMCVPPSITLALCWRSLHLSRRPSKHARLAETFEMACRSRDCRASAALCSRAGRCCRASGLFYCAVCFVVQTELHL